MFFILFLMPFIQFSTTYTFIILLFLGKTKIELIQFSLVRLSF